MPAVQIEHLARQVEDLELSFEQPDLFMRRLREIMDAYADHTFRSGTTIKIRPVLSTYQIPPPIMRHLIQRLSTTAQKVGRPTVAICDALWQEPVYEYRMLASHLISQIPGAFSSVILERVFQWAPQCKDTDILTTLFNVSLAGVRKNDVSAYLEFIGRWSNSSDVDLQRLACIGLMPLIEDDHFENFPAIFALLSPLARTLPQEISTEVSDVVKILARRSPSETVYFLRQVMLTSANKRPEVLIRFVLPELPPYQQANLRTIMRAD